MIRVRNMFAALILTSAVFLLPVRGQYDYSDYCSGYSPKVAPVCFMLYMYKSLEQTLVNDPLNLYKLRHVFFPNANANPIVVTVAYNIRFQNITDEYCPGVRIVKNKIENISRLDNSASHIKFSANITWTSSVAFSVLHPDVINWLLPSLLYLFGPIRDNYGDNSADILLSLDVPFLSCIPSVNQVVDALNDLTTMLKAFAEAQALVSSSDSKYKGYTVQGTAKYAAYLFFYFPTLTLLIVIYLLYPRLIITKWASNYLKKISAKEKPYYQLFLSVYFVTMFLNVSYIIWEVLDLWISPGGKLSNTTVSKFVVFIVCCIIINLIPAYFVSRNSTDLRNLPKFFKTITFICFGVCCNKSHVARFLLAWNFLTFTSILVWSFIPTLILVFVNPIQTLAVVMFVLSLFFLSYTSFAVAFTYYAIADDEHNNDRLRKYGSLCLTVLIVIGVCIALCFMIALAVTLIHYGVSTDGILGFVLVFAPGIITGFAAWFSRKILAQYKDKQDAPTDEERGEQQPLLET